MEPAEDGEVSNDYSDDEELYNGQSPQVRSSKPRKITIEEQFEYATAWNSVLLFDECDAYLGKRSSSDSDQDRILNSE